MALLIAYIVLFMWSFLAATFFPVGSEAALVALVHREQEVLLPVLVATVGNYAGACTTYWLARKAAPVFAKHFRPKQDSRSVRLFKRYGQLALILTWVPFLGDGIVALAGAIQIPFAKFSLWVALGKGGRYTVLAWMAAEIL